jgi:hypothetical protein
MILCILLHHSTLHTATLHHTTTNSYWTFDAPAFTPGNPTDSAGSVVNMTLVDFDPVMLTYVDVPRVGSV